MVGFIGAGKMAQAMCKGIVRSGILRAEQIMASDPDGRVLTCWEAMGTRTTQCNRTIVENSDIIVMAVKPNMVRRILTDIYPSITKDHLVISVAAGISIDTMQQTLPAGSRVVRLMSNTPALVQYGATVFSRGPHTLPSDGDLVQNLMSTFGLCEEMAEKHLDAVTGLSGSGPAYMFMCLEALSDGGVKMGLPRETAMRLAAQTMIGSAKMVLESGIHPGELKDSVCSPSGSTMSGVFDLEKSGFRFALINAVQTASKRAYEIGLIENYDTASEATYASKNIAVSSIQPPHPLVTPSNQRSGSRQRVRRGRSRHHRHSTAV